MCVCVHMCVYIYGLYPSGSAKPFFTLITAGNHKHHRKLRSFMELQTYPFETGWVIGTQA